MFKLSCKCSKIQHFFCLIGITCINKDRQEIYTIICIYVYNNNNNKTLKKYDSRPSSNAPSIVLCLKPTFDSCSIPRNTLGY